MIPDVTALDIGVRQKASMWQMENDSKLSRSGSNSRSQPCEGLETMKLAMNDIHQEVQYAKDSVKKGTDPSKVLAQLVRSIDSVMNMVI